MLARKLRLGGQAQISLEKYPRIVFAVAVSLSHVVDFRRSPRSKVAASLRQFCLALDNLSVSMDVGSVLAKRRIQGLLFPSVVGTDANLVVNPFRANAGEVFAVQEPSTPGPDQMPRIFS